MTVFTVFFIIFLLTLLVITALAIVQTKNLFAAAMLSGIFSLLSAMVFFLLDAADVALTEAAVGAGISTVLFLGALALTAEHERAGTAGRLIALGVVTVIAALLVYATFDMPRLGDPNAPAQLHVAPWYLEKTPEYIDVPNVVTAVLASFRGYDTLGETFVVFTAGIGVLFLLGKAPVGQQKVSPAMTFAGKAGLRHYQIPRVVGRLLIPFILLFALYVQFHGDYSPGGGFQAGVIVAASVVLYALLEGEERARQALPAWLLRLMAATGPLLYGFTGVTCMLLGGNFLDYSVLAHDPVHGQHYGILVIEAGVGITVTGVLISIFHAFAARGAK
jgi:multicomponent Na+:H+ antiporter subunit B